MEAPFLLVHLASAWASVPSSTHGCRPWSLLHIPGSQQDHSEILLPFPWVIHPARKEGRLRGWLAGHLKPTKAGRARYPRDTALVPQGYRITGAGGGAGAPFVGQRAPSWPEAGTAEAPSQAPSHAACFLARGHAGHWLSTHAHVHAPPQHRDQAAAVHQVSGHTADPRGIRA